MLRSLGPTVAYGCRPARVGLCDVPSRECSLGAVVGLGRVSRRGCAAIPGRPMAVLGSKQHFARFLLLCSTTISEALNGIHH